MIFLIQTCQISGYSVSFPDPKNPKIPDHYYVLAFWVIFCSKGQGLFSWTLHNKFSMKNKSKIFNKNAKKNVKVNEDTKNDKTVLCNMKKKIQ